MLKKKNTFELLISVQNLNAAVYEIIFRVNL